MGKIIKNSVKLIDFKGFGAYFNIIKEFKNCVFNEGFGLLRKFIIFYRFMFGKDCDILEFFVMRVVIIVLLFKRLSRFRRNFFFSNILDELDIIGKVVV